MHGTFFTLFFARFVIYNTLHFSTAVSQYQFPNQLRVCELIFYVFEKSKQNIFPHLQYVSDSIIFGRMLP